MLLQFIALILIFNNLNFHKSKYVNSANLITGGIYAKISKTTEYFNLQANNQFLLEENIKLKNLLEKSNSVHSNINFNSTDSLEKTQKFTFSNAKIIKNDFSKAYNYLLINKGSNQNINKEMAIINSKGIVGIIDYTTNNFARVQSILNKNTKINARLKGNNFYFGTLKWDGLHYNTVQLHDIPRQALLKIGDTIETGGRSTIFPEGILIGTIAKINNGNSTNNKIDIKLFNDMSNLGYVYIIKSLHRKEIKELENLENE